MREFLLCRFLYQFRVFPRFDNPRDVSDTPQTMSGLLVFLTSPLHRQYKTARTETRWHLLLKIRQMPIQTSASRGYVLFIGDVRNTQKSLNCLSACGHTCGVLKTWKTRIITDVKSGRVRNSVFCDPNSYALFLFWNSAVLTVIVSLPVYSPPCVPASFHSWRYRLACPFF